MQNRRDFIKLAAGTFSMGSLLIPDLVNAVTAPKIPQPGVQLFTFFSVLDDDVEGTLKKIADLGIKQIESAFSRKGDYYGYKPKEFASLLQNLGMTWRAHHVFGAPVNRSGNPTNSMPPFKNLVENSQQIIDEAAEAGLHYLVAAHLPIGSGQEIRRSLAILTQAAEATKKAGIQLVYHNESKDFEPVDGIIPYDVFLTESDPDALKFELDIPWAIKAGVDPIALFTKHPGRFPLWHIKGLAKDHTTVLPLGQGVLDYRKYFQYAQESGLKYYFIEHESPTDPFASLSASVAYIKKSPFILR